jgi:hypothetical protein
MTDSDDIGASLNETNDELQPIGEAAPGLRRQRHSILVHEKQKIGGDGPRADLEEVEPGG